MDKNLENIINRVANRNSLPAIKVKLAVETFFKTQKQLMQREDMPTIMIHNLGRFVANPTKIKRKLLSLRQNLVNNKISQEEYDKETKRFTEILNRLEETKHTRKN